LTREHFFKIKKLEKIKEKTKWITK